MREKSSIEFPYLDLDEAIETAKGVRSIGDPSCPVDSLSKRLKLSATRTRARVSAAKIFRIMSISQSFVTLTDLGNRICDPEQEALAKVEAFLSVPLYKIIYAKFKAVVLPEPLALESILRSEGVPEKQKNAARRIFMRSAKQAGFFEVRHDMLVSPVSPQSVGGSSQPFEKPSQDHGEVNSFGKTSDCGGKDRHLLINGLIMNLPPEGEWTIEARKKWLQAASCIFELVYSDSREDRGTLVIAINKDCAK